MHAGRAEETEIGRLIDEAPISGFQKRVIVLCSLATFLDGYDVQALGLAIPRLSDDFGVAPTTFAAALSGSLIGMAAGAMFLGSLADRFGRRPMLIAMMITIGLTTLGAMFAANPTIFTLWRVLTGLGLGGTVPIAIAMTSEYVPARRRAALVTLMVVCTAFGSFAAGIVAPMLDALWGWRGIFALGAALPLGMAVVLWGFFPESLRFLIARGRDPEEVARQIARIAPDRAGVIPVVAAPAEAQRPSVGALFGPIYRARTILLWVIFWLNLFANYSLISWLPTLLRSAGWEHGAAQRATGLLALGGIMGGLLVAWLADRGRSISALVCAYIATTILLSLFIVGPGSVTAWMMMLLLVGAGAFGAQMALGSMSAAYYPPELRSTGVGWSGGIGRTGAIVGPLAFAGLMKAGLATSFILGLLMIPMAICAGCVLLLPGALRARP